MGIKKQEFYEGAALHILARSGRVGGIRYDAPFFIVNDRLLVHLKYSTRSRSPWGFTFDADEQALLETKATEHNIVIGLICGADGDCGLPLRGICEHRDAEERLRSISPVIATTASTTRSMVRTEGCDGKVAPSNWQEYSSAEVSMMKHRDQVLGAATEADRKRGRG